MTKIQGDADIEMIYWIESVPGDTSAQVIRRTGLAGGSIEDLVYGSEITSFRPVQWHLCVPDSGRGCGPDAAHESGQISSFTRIQIGKINHNCENTLLITDRLYGWMKVIYYC